nr:hypothetical protein CFP56_69150 [Quercus suber]
MVRARFLSLSAVRWELHLSHHFHFLRQLQRPINLRDYGHCTRHRCRRRCGSLFRPRRSCSDATPSRRHECDGTSVLQRRIRENDEPTRSSAGAGDAGTWHHERHDPEETPADDAVEPPGPRGQPILGDEDQRGERIHGQGDAVIEDNILWGARNRVEAGVQIHGKLED